jgi:hypothetical protein
MERLGHAGCGTSFVLPSSLQCFENGYLACVLTPVRGVGEVSGNVGLCFLPDNLFSVEEHRAINLCIVSLVIGRRGDSKGSWARDYTSLEGNLDEFVLLQCRHSKQARPIPKYIQSSPLALKVQDFHGQDLHPIAASNVS